MRASLQDVMAAAGRSAGGAAWPLHCPGRCGAGSEPSGEPRSFRVARPETLGLLSRPRQGRRRSATKDPLIVTPRTERAKMADQRLQHVFQHARIQLPSGLFLAPSGFGARRAGEQSELGPLADGEARGVGGSGPGKDRIASTTPPHSPT